MSDLVTVNDDIFNESPEFAYAMLGYCDGRAAAKCDPPKGKHRAIYMQEYNAGLQSRNNKRTK